MMANDVDVWEKMFLNSAVLPATYSTFSALLVSIVLNPCERPGTVQVRDQVNLHECAEKWFRP